MPFSILADCGEVAMLGSDLGVYMIYPGNKPVQVYCEKEDDHMWTYIQQRRGDWESFNRDWTEYKSGFGDHTAAGNYWFVYLVECYLTLSRNLQSADDIFY